MVRAVLALAAVACCLAAGPVRGERGLVDVGGTPQTLFAGQGSLWVLTCDRGCTGEGRHAEGRLVRIDPRSARVVASGSLSRPGTAAIGGKSLYVTDFWRDRIRRIDLRSLRVVRALRLRLPFRFSPRDNAFVPEAVAAGRHAVWVVTDRGALARADLQLKRVVATLRLPADAFGDPEGGMAAGDGTVWLAESLAGVYRVDPRRNRIIARIRLPRFDATEVIRCGGNVLVLGVRTSGGALTARYELARIDLPRNSARIVSRLRAGPVEMTCGAEFVWLGRPQGSTLERIDPGSGRLLERRRARIGTDLAFAAGHLWTTFPDGTVRQLR